VNKDRKISDKGAALPKASLRRWYACVLFRFFTVLVAPYIYSHGRLVFGIGLVFGLLNAAFALALSTAYCLLRSTLVNPTTSSRRSPKRAGKHRARYVTALILLYEGLQCKPLLCL
jgi:hypothetical protein